MEQLNSDGRKSCRNAIQFGRHTHEAGFTLIELIVAGAVLVVGVLAMSGLVALAVASNGHSRLDTTAVMLTQAVTEQVSAGINYSSAVGGAGTASLTDCGTHNTESTAWPVQSANGGAPVSSGKIDFTQPKVSGYQMDYVVCNGTTQTTYDVRWNLSPLASSGTTSHTNLLTVGARMKGGGMGPLSFPINLHVMVGPDPVPGS